MLTVAQALSKAAGTTRWAIGMCDQFVANMYGYSASGYPTANDNWIASKDKHPGDFNAPAGALMFWGGGAGHVALADGTGGIYSTDISGNGTVSHVPATEITQKWGKPYLGWANPQFEGQVGSVSPVSGVEPAGFFGDLFGDLTGGDVTAGLEQGFLSALQPMVNYGLWGFETLIGIVMILAGVFFTLKVYNLASA